ncbi:MAG: IS5/IS1182 family transposase [Gammaproteobacteria bacterium]|jgi:transposase|nr:IS5/IS1182 family transposase [Gammaproteobacteria bacterium]
MSYIDGEPRGQTSLLPASLDDFVPSDHPVRVIDAFVCSLDLAELGFSGTVDEVMGRPRYRPQALLKLYIYGYLNQVRSSRKLERECQRNVEVMWLLEKLAPDFKTIADFRRDNGAGLKQVCRAFVLFCNEARLLGQEVAVDGSKFRAAASKDQVVTRSQLEKRRAAVDRQVEQYLQELEAADSRQEHTVKREHVEAALEQLTEERAALDLDDQAMRAEGKSQHCRTEPEARLMRSGRNGSVLGYNIQSVVETAHKLIVHHEVTQSGGDNRLLYPMAREAKAVLGQDRLTVLADAGYSSGEHLQRCDDDGITALVPPNRAVNNTASGGHYQRAVFVYEPSKDAYRCPAGEWLRHKTFSSKNQVHLYTTDACASCHLRSNCTSADRRWVSRHFHEAAFERSAERLRQDRGAMIRRKASVEAPFGTIKRQMGDGRFLCRGLSSVKAEMALSVLAYNLKRLMNVVGIRALLGQLA